MQEKDHILKEYEKDSRRFCDFVNGVLAGGRPLLRPERLEVMPTEILKIIEVETETAESRETGAESGSDSAAYEFDERADIIRKPMDSACQDTESRQGADSGCRTTGFACRDTGNCQGINTACQTTGSVRKSDGFARRTSARRTRRVKTVQRFRDLARKYWTEDGYIIIAIQNQSTVDFGMPLRVMLEDALEYDAQRRLLKNEKLHKGEKLLEVITIVFYHGGCPWSGATDMSEIVHVPEKLKVLEEYRRSYPIILVTPDNVEAEQFSGEWREVFEVLKRQNDEKAMEELLENKDNQERYKRLSEETTRLLFALTGRLDDYKRAKEKGEVSMCKAFADHYQSGVREGRKEGKKEGRKEGIRIGERRGERRGEERGEARLQSLIAAMVEAGEVTLLPRLGEDKGFVAEMYLKHKI